MFGFMKSKTVWAGFLVALLGVLEKFDITNFAEYIPDQYEPLVVSAVGFLMVVLRFLTTKPLTEK